MVKVLIIEDDSSARLVTKLHLRNEYQVVEASDGMEAMELLKHQSVDLIIADVMMPKMDGYELTKQLLEDEAEYSRMSKSSNPYGDGHASKYIVDAIIEKFAEIAKIGRAHV